MFCLLSCAINWYVADIFTVCGTPKLSNTATRLRHLNVIGRIPKPVKWHWWHIYVYIRCNLHDNCYPISYITAIVANQSHIAYRTCCRNRMYMVFLKLAYLILTLVANTRLYIKWENVQTKIFRFYQRASVLPVMWNIIISVLCPVVTIGRLNLLCWQHFKG